MEFFRLLLLFACILVRPGDLYTMIIWYCFITWYLDALRHAGKVFTDVPIDAQDDVVYARNRLRKYLVVSACEHESEVCEKAQAAFGISLEDVVLESEFCMIRERLFELSMSPGWTRFHRLDFEMYEGIVS